MRPHSIASRIDTRVFRRFRFNSQKRSRTRGLLSLHHFRPRMTGVIRFRGAAARHQVLEVLREKTKKNQANCKEPYICRHTGQCVVDKSLVRTNPSHNRRVRVTMND